MTFFHEYLDEAQRPTKWQINMSTMDDEQREIAAYIVGNLDENGYLHVPLAEISEALGCSEEKV